MSKIIIRMDDKTFSTFVPKAIAENRFIELCSLAMKNNGADSTLPLCLNDSSMVIAPPQGTVNIRFAENDADEGKTCANGEDTSGNDENKPSEDNYNKNSVTASHADMNKPDDETDTEGETYRGFLHIVCEKCGKSFSFSAKAPISNFKCQDCGHVTKLKNLGRMKMTCECGRTWRYHTNALSELVELNCVACHSPMVAQMDKHGDYWPLLES